MTDISPPTMDIFKLLPCGCDMCPNSDGPDEYCPEHGRRAPGDWVVVIAQVAENQDRSGGCLNVELFSKTDQYQALVRQDLVRLIEPPLQGGLATRCTAMAMRPDGLYVRCEGHLHHWWAGSQHYWTKDFENSMYWSHADTRAYLEEA